jgi:exonuclease III
VSPTSHVATGSIGVPMSAQSIFVWNMWGLNGQLHRDALRELVAAECPSIMCVQETKLSVINDFDVMQCLSPGFDYFFLPTD